MALNKEYEGIGSDIIAAAFFVRNNSPRGMREKYYESALIWTLRNKYGYKVEKHVKIPVKFCGEIIDKSYEADVVVDDRVIIEVKALGQLGEGESRQLQSYLHLSNFKLGYLINFGVSDFKFGKLDDPFPHRRGLYRIVNGLEDDK